MGSEMQQGICLEDEFQVGIEGGETVMRRRTLGEEKPHGVTLVTKGGLHTQEDVAELFAVDQHILAIGVQLARRWAPVLMQVFGERTQLLVLIHAHAVGHVQLRHRHGRLRVFQNGLLQAFHGVGDVFHRIALLFQFLHDCVDAAKDIQVGRCAHVALVRWELEHANAQLLLRIGFPAQVGPVHGTRGQAANAILHGDGASTGAITTREDQGLNGAIDFWQAHLQGHLHRVKSQLAVLPLREGLEHQGNADHVGTVQLHEDLFGLLGILGSRATHQGEARQVHQGVHLTLAPVVRQVLLHRDGEVQSTGVGADHTGTTAFQLLHHADIMAIILGGDVRLL
mmetsp:Transcript_92826/g.113691  ORF Transcript_92826/g.113691 Transcript_92826/m.113691 type:complete len:340 (+) Transcript_92826:1893-2912(+)